MFTKHFILYKQLKEVLKILNKAVHYFKFLGKKKGVSPLIATVLLIAFAVALGAVVMNWGKSYVEEQTKHAEEKSNLELRCEMDIELAIKQIRGDPQLCYTNGTTTKINFMLENRGTENIEAIQLTIIAENDIYTENIPNSQIKTSGIRKFTQEYTYADYGEIDIIEFTPLIKTPGTTQPTICSKNTLTIEEIYPCD